MRTPESDFCFDVVYKQVNRVRSWEGKLMFGAATRATKQLCKSLRKKKEKIYKVPSFQGNRCSAANAERELGEPKRRYARSCHFPLRFLLQLTSDRLQYLW